MEHNGIKYVSVLKPVDDETAQSKLHFLLDEFDSQDNFVEDIRHAILKLSDNATAIET